MGCGKKWQNCRFVLRGWKELCGKVVVVVVGLVGMNGFGGMGLVDQDEIKDEFGK